MCRARHSTVSQQLKSLLQMSCPLRPIIIISSSPQCLLWTAQEGGGDDNAVQVAIRHASERALQAELAEEDQRQQLMQQPDPELGSGGPVPGLMQLALQTNQATAPARGPPGPRLAFSAEHPGLGAHGRRQQQPRREQEVVDSEANATEVRLWGCL